MLIRRLIILHLSVVVSVPLGILAGELPRIEDLSQLTYSDRDWPPAQERARQLFPLTNARVSSLLSEAMVEGMSPKEEYGFVVVLCAHGPYGFLWLVNQLAANDSASLRGVIVWFANKFNYREAYVLYISLLEDKRVCPPRPNDTVDLGRPKEPPTFGFPPYAGPMRVCDLAFIKGCLALGIHKLMPEKYKELYREVWGGVPIPKRDEYIGILKDWWAKEGERIVTAKCPSVVEVLLKEAEERSKQAELGAQGAKAEGVKGEEKPKEAPAPESEKKEPEKK